MNDLKILFCEDAGIDITLVDAYIKNIKSKFTEINIDLKTTDFDQVFSKLNDPYALLILDMYKGNERVGEKVLDFIVNQNIVLPVIIYTTGSKDVNLTNYNDIIKKYGFVSNVIIKGDKGEDLRIAIERIIFQKDRIIYFQPYDEDDIFLQAEIIAIGKNSVNEILYKIKSDIAFKDTFILERMSSGFSGAAVFKLKHDNKSSILKISREIETLKKELENANRLYMQFPSRFRINIGSKEYSNDKVVAFLIEEVECGLPLFKWLTENHDKDGIDTFFQDLFLKNGLKEHYSKRKDTKKEKFVHIFKKFDEIRYSLIQKAIKELGPIIDHFPDLQFNESDIKNLILYGSYRNLDKNKLLEDKFKKELVLCHGDFHSNNIMVQEKRPVIIDTGGIRFDYWCMDLCRLIVNLFIAGVDKNTYDFYDLRKIKNNFEIACQIINQEIIASDKENKGYIHAINWLTQNVEEIYGDLYSKWEFQLGLMKEFLQASYRTNYIPPSKRVLALLSANKCMISANEEIKK